MRAIILLCLCWISSVGASHFFVTVPNVLRFDHEETVLVNVFKEKDFNVEIWLQIEDREFSRTIVTVPNEATPVTATVKVTENHLFKDKDEKKKPTRVTLYAKTRLGTFSRNLLLSYDTGYILVQTSKPLYHPHDKVHVRALAMTELFRPAKGWNVTMDIISPSNLTYGRREKDSDSKFFEDSFTLPPHAEEGLWTVRAFYRGQFQTEGRTHFRVSEYVLPTFGVTIKVKEDVILDTTENVTITVIGKYVYKKPVKGKAIIKIHCLADDGSKSTLPGAISKNLEGDGTATFTIRENELNNLKDECGGFATLDGQRLLVSARVIEIASGKEEIAANSQTVFSETMYKLTFEKSKKSYRPGLSYYLRVSVRLANGDIPDPVNVTVHKFPGGEIEDAKSDAFGNALLIFTPPSHEDDSLTFRVLSNDTSQTFVVHAYKGSDQIQVDQVKRQDNKMVVKSILQNHGDTGIMTLFLSRGRYIHHEYFPAATEAEKEIFRDVQEKMSPEARIVSFFISKSGRFVADSAKIQLEPKCRGKGLELHTDSTTTPNNFGKLDIKGSPNMGVGLNIMDKALLLLDRENVLRKSKMFDLMKSHDLGCGEGGGTNAEIVLRDAGLTIVSNVKLNPNSLDKASVGCDGHTRKKRSIDCEKSEKQECCKVGSESATEILLEYAGYENEIDVRTKCHGSTLKIAELRLEDGRYKYSTACLQNAYLKCVEVLFEGIEGSDVTAKSGQDGDRDYLDALKELDVDIRDIIRKKFNSDSWMFTSVDLDEEGNSDEIQLQYPSSITEWMIQAVGISETQGLCIAEPKNVTASKSLFIQLDLPYKAVRLEYLDIKVSVFNYNENGNSAKINLFIDAVNDLCTGGKPGEKWKIGKFVIKDHDSAFVRVPVLPLEAKKFPIRVIAIGWVGAEPVIDAVEKDLLVVSEGVEEREVITVCLSPFKSNKKTDCENSDRVRQTDYLAGGQTNIIDMTLPENALIGTGSAFAYATSNAMDDVVKTILSGIDNMLRQPTGCGEQTMLYLGPSVYVMSYWKNTEQMTPERELKGNGWIRDGVKRELTFRKRDGSYAAWLHRPSSTWLTAFVGKVFCQAKHVVDDAIKYEEHVVPTLRWLETKIDRKTGAFRDDQPVIHREMIGQIKEADPSLTAFVLITLLECKDRNKDLQEIEVMARQYLENIPDFLYKNNPYLLAMSTYALALAKSNNRKKMKQMLLDKAHKNNDNEAQYWGNPGGFPANENSIETTAYAMLALMQYENGIRYATPIVRWLNRQRSAAGSFRTTQDTVIGLQSLSEYTIKTYNPNVNLKMTLTSDDGTTRSQTLTNENKYVLETIENIPVKAKPNSFLTVNTEGEGSGKLVIDYRYNRPKSKQEKCGINISTVVIGDVNQGVNKDKVLVPDFNRECDVCGNCADENEKNDNVIFGDGQLFPDPLPVQPRALNEGNEDNADPKAKKQYCITFTVSSLNKRNHGMSIIDVGLQTGMQVVKSDLEQLKNEGKIDSFEMPDNEKGFFILYLNKISSEPVEFKFKLEDHFDGNAKTRQPSRIHVYDYYKPEHECLQFYGIGGSDGSPVEYICEDNGEAMSKSTHCSCLKALCPDPDKKIEELIELGIEKKKSRDKKKKGPVNYLAEDICVDGVATFAALVKITNIKFDVEKQIRMAEATVVKSIHKGTDALENGSKIGLYWRVYCKKDLFEVNKQYYIMSSDGEESTNARGEKIFKYQMLDTTTIVQWRDLKKAPKRTTADKKKNFLQFIMNAFTKAMTKKDGGCKN